MTKPKTLNPLWIAIIIVVIVLLPAILMFSLSLFAWSAIFIGGWLSPDPPKPEVTYAEFPFEIVYTVEGETVTVNDIYVCEYVGVGWDEGRGKYRQWKGYIKSSGEDDLILLEDENYKLACSVGDSGYYMSDPSMPTEKFTPHVYYIRSHKSDIVSLGTMDIEQLKEQYKIKLISWKLSSPIQNSFE